MRKAIYILVALCSLAPLFLQAQEPNYNELWNRANNHYSLGEYQDALSAYKQIEEAGMVSYKLYYNIANTYYKLKEDGHALLYYERALKLNPSDKDIKNNLEIAKLKTLDKIEVIPDFILTVWIGKLKNSLSSDSWAKISILLLAAVAVLLLLYRHASTVAMKKGAFAFGCIVLLFAICSLIFSFNLRSKAVSEDYAIVMVPVSNIKSAPNSTGNNLFILHEGTKIEVLEQVDTWSRIELSDGRQGWVQSSDFEII